MKKELKVVLHCESKVFKTEKGEEIEYTEIIADIPDSVRPSYVHKIRMHIDKKSKDLFDYIVKE